MPEKQAFELFPITRRAFVSAVAATAVAACRSDGGQPPSDSPIYRGRYSVARALLGTTPGTPGLPFPGGIPWQSATIGCADGSEITVPRPQPIPVLVYYPSTVTSYDVSRAIDIHPDGHFPLVLYCHARRRPLCAAGIPPGLDPVIADVSQDFRRIDYVLAHVASHGIVVAVPDVGWDWNRTEDVGAWPSLSNARAQVLFALYILLRSFNTSVFQQRIDTNVLGLAGHSTGAAAILIAREHLLEALAPEPRAYVFLAPATTSKVAALAGHVGQTMTIKGAADNELTANPDEIFGSSALPKARVRIGGANHFGYTELCTADNFCADGGQGGIPLLAQQLAAATFMGAFLRRFLRDDLSMSPYLDGSKDAGLSLFGVTSLVVEGYGV